MENVRKFTDYVIMCLRKKKKVFHFNYKTWYCHKFSTIVFEVHAPESTFDNNYPA